MIIEHAIFRVKPGQESDFETAFPNAGPHIAASEGFIGMDLHRSVEKPSTYHLLVRWRSLDDHMVGFRESDRFAKWREVIGPFFDTPPEVEHFETALASA